MKLFMLAPLLFLMSCTTPTTLIEVDQAPLARPKLTVPNIDKFSAKKVTWVIITEDNITEIFNDLQKQGKPLVLFAVTDQGYENIAINTKEALRIILQQQAVINGYQKYYITADGVIYEFNKNT